jgi:hypothetical protein
VLARGGGGGGGGVMAYYSGIHRSMTGGYSQSGIGLSYRHATLHCRRASIRHPYARVDFIRQSGIYEFGYWLMQIHYSLLCTVLYTLSHIHFSFMLKGEAAQLK